MHASNPKKLHSPREDSAHQCKEVSQGDHPVLLMGKTITENNSDVLLLCSVLHQLMHETVSNAAVIWYDAVTTEGNLHWQDNLTDLNRDFFHACDGLFVNYTWKAETPVKAAETAGLLM